jgi:hypothetical protein
VGNYPVVFVDPSGLYNYDFHHDVTLKLAQWAGIPNDVAEKIAKTANSPDEDKSNPLWAFENWLFTNPSLSSNANAKRMAKYWLDQAMEWHFPVDPKTHKVVPGGPVARSKVETATLNGSIGDFGKGLHVLQDSYSHQGVPFIKGTGHSRGAQPVYGTEWNWETVYMNVQTMGGTWVQLPIAAVPKNSRVFLGYRLISGAAAALDHSADDPKVFPATARDAAMATYRAIVAFKNKWQKITGSTHDAWSEQDVMAKLEEMFPGNDPTE